MYVRRQLYLMLLDDGHIPYCDASIALGQSELWIVRLLDRRSMTPLSVVCVCVCVANSACPELSEHAKVVKRYRRCTCKSIINFGKSAFQQTLTIFLFNLLKMDD